MDEGYKEPVNGVGPEELAEKMKKAHDEVRKIFPKRTGILVMTFDFGPGGGVGYICNGQRSDMINLLEEWIRNQRKMS